MPLRRLVLASASPARLRLLRAAGFDPDVIVSGVDEDDLEPLPPAELAAELAERKARAVAERIRAQAGTPPSLVVGCDSVLDVDGTPYGKPGSKPEAIERWHVLRGRDAILRTGHCVIDLGGDGEVHTEVASTVVRFGSPTDEEIARYVGSGEPLGVAGAFTLDGRSAPFIDGVDGDPGNVIGLSLPLLRSLVERTGLSITDLWA